MSTENNQTLNNDKTFSLDESRFKIKSRTILGAPEVPNMIRVMVKKGFVKNENQAAFLILTMIILLFGVSVFLVYRSAKVPRANLSPDLMSY